jgi:two-component system, OmpR family, phosphate regulon sensor histidine kinase PhoR
MRGSFITSHQLILSIVFLLLCCLLLLLWFTLTPVKPAELSSLILPLSIAFCLLVAGLVILYILLRRKSFKLYRGLQSSLAENWQQYESLTLLLRKTGWFDQLEAIKELIQGKNETIQRQQSERLALLSSMVEGVLAVDNQERVLIVNKAAGELFDVDGANAAGRMLHEVIRNMAVQKLVSHVFAEGRAVEGEITVLGEEERKLLAHASPLRDAAGEQIGVIVVFNDITKLEKYERIRQDFVANVSHELKTPITAIKGFVETLRSRKPLDAADSAHFLEIIAEETDRMNAIVNDLLALTSVEHDDESAETVLTQLPVKPVAQAAMVALEAKAREHGIALELESAPDISALINAPLFEQALINLLDNAINYSEPGKAVRMEITADDQTACIAVRDQGIGIDKRYIPRLTERFFRVDKSRSRKQGGTGLGLAIVKHIVKAHYGELSIESEPGVGSTFTIILPLISSNSN